MIMALQRLRRAIAIAAAFAIAAYSSTFASASPYGAQQLVGAWEGSYYCNEDYQLATIKIWESGGQLVGTFSFRPSPGRRGYVGSYEFVVQQRGEEIMFLPTRWIQRPRGIEMTPSTVKFRRANRLEQGEYLSITEHDGVMRTFRIVSVRAV